MSALTANLSGKSSVMYKYRVSSIKILCSEMKNEMVRCRVDINGGKMSHLLACSSW